MNALPDHLNPDHLDLLLQRAADGRFVILARRPGHFAVFRAAIDADEALGFVAIEANQFMRGEGICGEASRPAKTEPVAVQKPASVETPAMPPAEPLAEKLAGPAISVEAAMPADDPFVDVAEMVAAAVPVSVLVVPPVRRLSPGRREKMAMAVDFVAQAAAPGEFVQARYADLKARLGWSDPIIADALTDAVAAGLLEKARIASPAGRGVVIKYRLPAAGPSGAEQPAPDGDPLVDSTQMVAAPIRPLVSPPSVAPTIAADLPTVAADLPTVAADLPTVAADLPTVAAPVAPPVLAPAVILPVSRPPVSGPPVSRPAVAESYLKAVRGELRRVRARMGMDQFELQMKRLALSAQVGPALMPAILDALRAEGLVAAPPHKAGSGHRFDLSGWKEKQ